MIVLGISALDKDATVCIYRDDGGAQWSALAEERLSRVKLHKGFPFRALETILRHCDLNAAEIDAVVYPFRSWWVEGARMLGGYVRDIPFALTGATPWASKRRHLSSYASWCRLAIHDHRHYHRELERELRTRGLGRKLVRVEHHLSHAASAYLSSGFDEALAITLDWYGGGLSGSISRASAAGIESLHEFRYPHSLGLFYAQVTTALGFRPSRHEGKIVGLAAYGDPDVLTPRVLERFERTPGNLRYRSGLDPEFAKQLAAEFPREEVAAAYQQVLETVVAGLVEHWLKSTGLKDVVLAGGVAANVKMNQRVAEVDGVRGVFIHPAMGDGGTSVGAVLAFLLERSAIRSTEWPGCYLGPEYSRDEMRDALTAAGLEPVECDNITAAVARLLADGKVVARFHGAMEYGPRALGHRSILCSATDPGVNDWLNERLGRTEFMPFAPATLFEHREARYKDIDRIRVAARFMTITCNCTELMRRESPAAVHVDGTARPQIVTRDDNEDLHDILEAYHGLTGIPTLINTSFNMHEEPIVCTPSDAVRAFQRGHLNALAMGPYLVSAAGPGQSGETRCRSCLTLFPAPLSLIPFERTIDAPTAPGLSHHDGHRGGQPLDLSGAHHHAQRAVRATVSGALRAPRLEADLADQSRDGNVSGLR
jgi:carbamoyltransferase